MAYHEKHGMYATWIHPRVSGELTEKDHRGYYEAKWRKNCPIRSSCAIMFIGFLQHFEVCDIVARTQEGIVGEQ